MQGWRLEMEDAHVSIDMPSRSDHTFLAVFDGHGGAGAAIYAADKMVGMIEKTPQWEKYLAMLSSNSNDDECMAVLGDALQQAFLNIDQEMKFHQNVYNANKNPSDRDSSGCTSVTCMITPNYILCANAGDSRCVLGSNGSTIPMSEDHKPFDEGERKRIENAGGTVQYKRVDGDLAVSRALGDFQFKARDDLPATEQRVSCFPDIRIHRRTPQDEVLLLACDGLWDVMSNDDATAMIRDLYSKGEGDVVLVAEEMVDSALNLSSKDNISAVVAKLPGAAIGDPSGGGVARIRDTRKMAEAKAHIKLDSDNIDIQSHGDSKLDV